MSRHWTLNDRLACALAWTIAMAPLPLASNRPWSWSLLGFATAIIGVIWAFADLRKPSPARIPFGRFLVPALLFGIAVSWAIVQTLPIVPATWTNPVWADVASALDVPVSATISVDPEKTRHGAMRLITYGLIFLLAAQLGRASKRAAFGTRLVVVAILAYGTAGLLQYLLDLEYILWIPKWAYLNDATGTFVGHAAFGSFIGIGFVCCMAMAAVNLAPLRPGARRSDRIARILTGAVPWILAGAVLFVTLLATHSRGALLATLAAGLVLIMAAFCARILSKVQTLGLLGLIGLVVILAVSVAGEGTMNRMLVEGDFRGDRPNLLRGTWVAIGDAPWTGHGLATFDQAFRPYRDLYLPRDVTYDFAHSTWFEVVMDLGWPAGLCLLASVIWVVGVCAAGLARRRQDQIYPVMAVSVAALLGLQALFDFAVQMPAVAALFAYLLGLGFAQSRSSRGASAVLGRHAAGDDLAGSTSEIAVGESSHP